MSVIPVLRLCAISEVTPRPLDWLWPHRLGMGKLSLLEGDPGLGKSFPTSNARPPCPRRTNRPT